MSAMSESSEDELEHMKETDQNDSILDRVCIAMPCSIGWENMKGNDEVRLCGGCDKNVYNISAMSKKRAEEVLSAPELPCLHIVRGCDGKIVTDDSPRWLRHFRNSWGKLIAISASLLAFFNWTSSSTAQETKKEPSAPAPTPRDMNMFQIEPTVIDGHPYARGYTVGSTEWRNHYFLEEWPARISAIGIYKSDLPNATYDSLKSLQKTENVQVNPISEQDVPQRIDRKAWTTFAAARQTHATACMQFLNQHMSECQSAAKQAMTEYQNALNAMDQRQHDPGFRAFIVEEKGKAEDLLQKCTSFFDDLERKGASKNK